MMWWDHGNWDAIDWLAMSLMMVVFWGGVVALVVWIVRSLSARADERGEATNEVSRADQVLAERFARGEIDDEEFTRRKELLHSGPSPS